MMNICLLMAHILMYCLSLISTSAQAPGSRLQFKCEISDKANSMKDACPEDEALILGRESGMVGKQLHGTSSCYTTKEVMTLENKVPGCCLEHAASMAKTFITSYAVVYIKSLSRHLLQTQWLVQVGEQHCFFLFPRLHLTLETELCYSLRKNIYYYRSQ